jgi:hypothetical protein
MGLIEPKLTLKHVQTSAHHTTRGRGKQRGLKGVKADAMTADPKAHKKNRELSEKISRLVSKIKPFDGGVPRFVLAWRLYPNKENAYWKTEALQHACGCSCGCFGPKTHHHPAPGKKPAGGKSAKAKRTKGKR